MYANPKNVLTLFGATEIAKLSTPRQYPVVSVDLLELTVASGDRSEYSELEIIAADAALVVINDALLYSEQEMNSYLAVRYLLPLSEAVIGANPLRGRCCDITRYRLAKAHPSDEITRRYSDAIAWLRELSKGTAELISPDEKTETVSPQNILQSNYESSWDNHY